MDENPLWLFNEHMEFCGVLLLMWIRDPPATHISASICAKLDETSYFKNKQQQKITTQNHALFSKATS